LSNFPKPKSSTPALFETTIKSFVPRFNTASIRFSGIPQRPKPPTKSFAPLGISVIASSADLKIFPTPIGAGSFLTSLSISGMSDLIEKFAVEI
jgi:hypothetical protein